MESAETNSVGRATAVLALLCGMVLGSTFGARAMTFTLDGHVMRAEGQIVEGDTGRLMALVQTLPVDEEGGRGFGVVSLSSPGGNLFEGMRLGTAIRNLGVETLVESGRTCASACAITFLGGQISGATSDGVRRNLQPGARLGYHGFFFARDEVHLVNETLDGARVVNALILEYARRMGSVDLGILSGLLNTPAASVEFIDTPREIEGLGIHLDVETLKPPKGWALAACRRTVSEMLGPLDPMGVDGRLVGDAEPMADLKTFRTRLLDDKYPRDDRFDAVRKAVGTLKPSDAVDLLAGQSLPMDAPKVGVWRFHIERGAGFYYDACYAVTDFTTIWTMVVEGQGPTTETRSFGALAGFDRDRPMW